VTTTNYTLEWLLPYVRDAMRGTGNFEYRTYADAVMGKLHGASVPGIDKRDYFQVSTGRPFDEQKVPWPIMQLLAEAFFYLFRHGYIAPAAGDNYQQQPVWYKYNVTQRGHEYFSGSEPVPEEARRYLEFLHQHVPKVDSVIEQYVTEALTAFERGAYFAAAVMVGAASEKAIYLLAQSLASALKPSSRRTTLEKALGERQLSALLNLVRRTIETESSGKNAPIPYASSEGASTHLVSLFEAIRVQRNDAVHPAKGTVSASSVRLLLHSFPYALNTTMKLRDWLDANPGRL
jgi:hypothetical protein